MYGYEYPSAILIEALGSAVSFCPVHADSGASGTTILKANVNVNRTHFARAMLCNETYQRFQLKKIVILSFVSHTAVICKRKDYGSYHCDQDGLHDCHHRNSENLTFVRKCFFLLIHADISGATYKLNTLRS